MKNLISNKYFYSVIFSFIAFFISSYLTLLHFQDTIPPCNISGCEVVLTSRYAEIMGIPVSLIGAIYYGLSIILSTLLLSNFKLKTYKIYLIFVLSGILASLYFLSLQVVVIKQFCQYCLITEASMLAIFLISMADIKKIKSVV